MSWSRRGVMQATGLGLLGAGLPRRARADVAATDRRFVFVFAYGGWDPSRVFGGPFSLPVMDVEGDAMLVDDGPVAWVDHPDRPSVADFFTRLGDRVLCLDGVEVDSISHSAASRLALSGDTSGSAPDWATRLAAAGAERFALPHVVARGPSLAGAYAPLVTRVSAGDGLAPVLSGEVLRRWSGSGGGPTDGARAAVDAWVADAARARAEQTAGTARGRVFADLAEAQDRAQQLQGLADAVAWPTDDHLDSQVDMALDLLELGVARCITLGWDALSWDSHANNDVEQSALYETLFAGLVRLVDGLDSRQGKAGRLADDTVVVVASEMGRTPQLNGAGGKDHWSTTSAMLLGAGVAGGRTVGAYDDGARGLSIDPHSLQLDEGGQRLDSRLLGATLMALGGADDQADLAGIEAMAVGD